jgi:hypothetical protein
MMPRYRCHAVRSPAGDARKIYIFQLYGTVTGFLQNLVKLTDEFASIVVKTLKLVFALY